MSNNHISGPELTVVFILYIIPTATQMHMTGVLGLTFHTSDCKIATTQYVWP